MEYYILSKEEQYITETVFNNNNEIIHNFTDNIEKARRFSSIEEIQKQAELFECEIVKITLNKEQIGE